ncbi:hypothetical protein V7146_23640 [Gottfriedia acidiceleris]|uniref:phage lytic cycle repressor MrpR family protein n=1 Tax=Gottfriedia acidiceleris TaxID=371036 RepID=UPI0030005B30
MNFIQENIQNTYQRIFKSIYRKEALHKKDLYEFTLIEIEELIRSFNLNTFNSVRLYVQVIKQYLRFCLEVELISKSVLEVVFCREWLKGFVVPTKYLTDIELYKIVDRCENAQDAVILLLIFEGVLGKTKSELLSDHDHLISFV